jgi:hypothetical protein
MHSSTRQIESIEELNVKKGGLTPGGAGAAMILSAANGGAHRLLEINLMNLGEHRKQCHVPE